MKSIQNVDVQDVFRDFKPFDIPTEIHFFLGLVFWLLKEIVLSIEFQVGERVTNLDSVFVLYFYLEKILSLILSLNTRVQLSFLSKLVALLTMGYGGFTLEATSY